MCNASICSLGAPRPTREQRGDGRTDADAFFHVATVPVVVITLYGMRCRPRTRPSVRPHVNVHIIMNTHAAATTAAAAATSPEAVPLYVFRVFTQD